MAYLSLGEIDKYLNTLYRRERSGNRLTPDQIQNLMMSCSIELFNTELAIFDKTKVLTKSLVRHRKSSALTLTLGAATYPADYARVWRFETAAGYPIDVINQDRDNEVYLRLNDVVLAPTSTNPLAVLQGDQIQVYPTTGVTSPVLTYVALPVTPIFDWVMTAADEQVYMEPTWSINSAGNLVNGLGGTGTVLYYGVTHYTGGTQDATPATYYNSQSVELDWANEDKSRIVQLAIQKLGLNDLNPIALRYGQNEEAKDNTFKFAQ